MGRLIVENHAIRLNIPRTGLGLVLCLFLGCGNSLQRTATEQLITSDAVDQTVAGFDFTDLAGETVYFDTTYLKTVKGVGFVNADYIISSIRQQLVAARCLLREKRDDADYVVEARVGTLGTDQHEVTYGMPANNLLSSAASILPGTPTVPTLPELSIAKRNEQMGAAKIGAFAYHRDSGEPVWQSGVRQASSTAKDVWVMGAGPIQSGNIYKRARFAGSNLGLSFGEDGAESVAALPVDYHSEMHFAAPAEKTIQAVHEEADTQEAEKPKGDAESKPADDKKRQEPGKLGKATKDSLPIKGKSSPPKKPKP
ncbi:DUF6655 family protein [Thalassoroseus pseudoceratinae]|uniref:DUF6655 family protein n=1 Tax=Thalassoroseus pseudoceratinae TaxID=2713176 RepID=UPI001420E21C|nr:DUF6655 family protein [Thalassoroseus pseudoceratinae]